MLVLASASPRRQELLRNAGISFAVQPADVDEAPLAGEGARDCAERLAREKALKVSQARPEDVVLGADTIVVVDGTILGKPADGEDAARMLRMLSGREHRVITGVCLVRPKFRGQGSVFREQESPEMTARNDCSDDEHDIGSGDWDYFDRRTHG
jgi:septum formation protein